MSCKFYLPFGSQSPTKQLVIKFASWLAFASALVKELKTRSGRSCAFQVAVESRKLRKRRLEHSLCLEKSKNTPIPICGYYYQGYQHCGPKFFLRYHHQWCASHSFTHLLVPLTQQVKFPPNSCLRRFGHSHRTRSKASSACGQKITA